MSNLNEKKIVSKVKSHNLGTRKPNFVPVKRKSLVIAEARKSLDLAADRMKKSKLVNDGHAADNAHAANDLSCSMLNDHISFNQTGGIIFADSHTSLPNNFSNNDNTSLMSTNFSHYELMRNLSASNCYSGVAFSATTCNVDSTNSETLSKREHLEKYFQSAEKWGKEFKIVDSKNSYF